MFEKQTTTDFPKPRLRVWHRKHGMLTCMAILCDSIYLYNILKEVKLQNIYFVQRVGHIPSSGNDKNVMLTSWRQNT